MSSSFTPPSPEELDQLFPAYKVESFIAQGGMGAVYLGRQLSLDRPVAIKILPQEFGDDPDFRISFETEAKAMARLNHTNLVGVYDFGDINNTLYIIMEYVPGRSLFDTAHKRSVDMKEAARLIADMCRGLDHAHRAGMLHRDIKPANVLIDDEARPKIVDFGLARPMDETHSGGVIFGTPGYTAPEVIADPSNVDQRADIFSMGAMLYELLTGSMPPLPYVSVAKVNDTHPAFDTIISKAIHPQREQRYEHASEMADALDQLVEDLDNPPALKKTPGLVTAATAPNPRTVSALSPRPRPVAVTSASKSPVGIIITLSIVVIAVIGVIIANSGSDDTERLTQQKAAAEAQAEEQRLAQIAQEKKRKQQLQLEQKKKRDEQLRAQQREREHQQKLAEERERKRLQRDTEKNSASNNLTEKKEKKEPAKAVEIPPFDHLEFIEQQRSIIAGPAGKTLLNYDSELRKNIDKFIRSTKRELRKLHNHKRAKAEIIADPLFEQLITEGRLPQEFDKKAPDALKDSLDVFLISQRAIDSKFERSFHKWRVNYTKNIENQILDLDKEAHADSIEELTLEKTLTKDDPTRIVTIARGLSPEATPPQEE